MAPDAIRKLAFIGTGLMGAPMVRRLLSAGLKVRVWNRSPEKLKALIDAGAECGWSALFPIIDAEVASEVCPLFFQLGQQDALARLCADAEYEAIEHRRISIMLSFADASDACNAAFVGGPVALAWSRFSDEVRARVRAAYMNSIEKWRFGKGFRIPGEFVIAAAAAPSNPIAN